MDTIPMRVGAEWRTGESTFDTIDPYSGAPWAVVAEASKQDVDDAVRAARDAFEGEWAAVPGRERGRLLRQLAGAILESADELAECETRDNGKLLREMGGQLRGLPAVRVLRRVGRQDRRPSRRHGPVRLLRVLDARADRRGRVGRPVELAAPPAHVQARARPRRRLHDGGEAVGAGTRVDPSLGRAVRTGWVPARRVKHR